MPALTAAERERLVSAPPPVPAGREREAAAAPALHAPAGAASVLRLQRAVGNRGVQALLGRAPAAAVQRAPDPDLEAVQAVKSLHLEEGLRPGVAAGEGVLRKRLGVREKAIADALAVSKEGSDRETALQADLKKTVAEIVATPDSKFLYHGLRDDVVDAAARLDRRTAGLAAAEVAYHQYDDVFASAPVVATLAAKGFTAADLKALVSQESGDLTNATSHDGFVGVAQMNAAAVKDVGEDPDGRADPKTAIPIAAKVLVRKAELLEKQLSVVPVGDDYKKFVLASYNAGPKTVADAQKAAIAMGRAGTAWSELVLPVAGKGADTSPLWKGIEKNPGIGAPKDKYPEISGYPDGIFKRM